MRISSRDKAMAVRAIRQGARVDDIAEDLGCVSADVLTWITADKQRDQKREDSNAHMRRAGLMPPAKTEGPMPQQPNTKMTVPDGAISAAKVATPNVAIDIGDLGLEAGEFSAALDMLLVGRAREFTKAHSSGQSLDRDAQINRSRVALFRAVRAYETFQASVSAKLINE